MILGLCGGRQIAMIINLCWDFKFKFLNFEEVVCVLASKIYFTDPFLKNAI